MSLLMDALRKAEQEKKEALKKRQDEEQRDQPVSEGEPPAASEPTELSLEPDATVAATPEEGADTGTGPLYAEDQIDWRSADEDQTELGLTPASEGDTTAGDTRDSEAAPLELEITGLEADTGENLEQYDAEHAIGPAGERRFADGRQDDDATETTQGDGRTFSETLGADPDVTQDETDASLTAETRTEVEPRSATPAGVFTARTGAFTRAETTAGESTLNEHLDYSRRDSQFTRDQTADTLGTTSSSLNQYSTSAAHNVFAASKHSSSAAWTIAALFSLVIVALVAYGVFYYYSVTPLDRNIPSPTVARGIETDIRETPVLTESIRPVDKTVASVDATPVLDEIAANIETEAVAAADPTAAPAAEAVDAASAAEPAAAAEESDRQAGSGTGGRGGEETAAATTAAAADAGEPAAAPEPARVAAAEPPAGEMKPAEPLQAPPDLIKISRSKTPQRQSRAVMDAYQAYNSGQYAVAKDLYRTVLSADPENRDALLGLAALAVREGNVRAAYRHYLKLLELNPADPVAKSALISLQGQADPVTSRSQLLLLLDKYPNAAYLHHALGNIYASQQRWPEAQEAYFEAYRNDPDNPNYALNLAVSLDHMGQQNTALKYYQDAIRLARGQPAAFDPVAVNVRVEELKTAAR